MPAATRRKEGCRFHPCYISAMQRTLPSSFLRDISSCDKRMRSAIITSSRNDRGDDLLCWKFARGAGPCWKAAFVVDRGNIFCTNQAVVKKLESALSIVGSFNTGLLCAYVLLHTKADNSLLNWIRLFVCICKRFFQVLASGFGLFSVA